jgi:hypothetical protein
MSMPSADVFRLVGGILSGLISGAAFALSWLTRRSAAKRTEFNSLARSVWVIEERVRHVPGNEDMRRIYSKLDDLAREVAELHGSSMGTQRMVETINRHLLERDK